jgi:chemotaxis protein methyltransferase CheR
MVALDDDADDRTRHIVFVNDAVAALATPPPAPLPARDPQAVTTVTFDSIDPDTARFYRRLFELRGLQVERYRPAVLARRERACLRALRVASVSEAESALDRDDLVERALQAVMIGVTSFFRDAPMYAALGELVRKLAGARPGGPRVLSVGCSDGAELYSLAILLAELGIAPAEMAGVDCRHAAIDQARQGIYTRTSVEQLPGTLRARYFDDVRGRPGHVQVVATVRSRCRWWVGDAFTLPAGEPYDIVACRNLAIYLQPPAAHALWARLAEQTRAGGIVVVGKAERPDQGSGFRRVGPCLYEKP